MKMAIIDRFEGELVVVEMEGVIRNIDRGAIPVDAHEGDAIVFINNKWTVDPEATKRRRQAFQALADELWE
jgi:hypothetical protein